MRLILPILLNCFLVLSVYLADKHLPFNKMTNIIKKAHQLPYGDILVDFLSDFVNMFKSHVHTYHETPPTPGTPAMVQFERKYGMLPSEYKKKLLSDSVLIN